MCTAGTAHACVDVRISEIKSAFGIQHALEFRSGNGRNHEVQQINSNAVTNTIQSHIYSTPETIHMVWCSERRARPMHYNGKPHLLANANANANAK